MPSQNIETDDAEHSASTRDAFVSSLMQPLVVPAQMTTPET